MTYLTGETNAPSTAAGQPPSQPPSAFSTFFPPSHPYKALISFKMPEDDREYIVAHVFQPPKASVAPKKSEDDSEYIKACVFQHPMVSFFPLEFESDEGYIETHVFEPPMVPVAPVESEDNMEYINAHDFEYKNPGRIAWEDHSRYPEQETLHRDIFWKCGLCDKRPIRTALINKLTKKCNASEERNRIMDQGRLDWAERCRIMEERAKKDDGVEIFCTLCSTHHVCTACLHCKKCHTCSCTTGINTSIQRS
ncbi:hypothetical protein BGX33_012474 [Mortierella sp. NVP41]|nr:hypothetical protein BGX33_012474 [Mortierella sp. NVP41]